MTKKPRIVKVDGKWDVELDRLGPYDMELVRAAMDYCKRLNEKAWWKNMFKGMRSFRELPITPSALSTSRQNVSH